MKRIVFGVLSTLVCLIFGLRTVYAQGSGVDMSKCIILTVKQGEEIKLDFAASTSGVKVKVEGVEGEREEDAPSSLQSYDMQPKYKATGTKIRVYGAIDQFTCYGNGKNLIALDVSQNVNLTKLYCYRNQLSSLDVSINLEYLDCYENHLSSLDVSKNVNLEHLDCYKNQLSSLDVSRNVKLAELYCYHNQLSSLDVSQNVKLTSLNCGNNQLSSLDVRQNVNLTTLYCYENKLSSLDVRQNANLAELYCSDNQLSSLDVSQNVKLTTLSCFSNQLSNLDVSRNVNLAELSCHVNQLSSLDVSRNVNLRNLSCDGNQLSSLDVSQNVNLTYLGCGYSQLSSLDVSHNVKLIKLACDNNQLSSLDVSKNTELEVIWVYGNNFSTSTLNGLYCQLPDRTGKEKGFIYPVLSKGDVLDELLAKSSSKTITDSKNWGIRYWERDKNIEEITGNYECGTDYALTLEPAAISKSFTYQGGEWKATVKSIGNWKVDETAPLPDWLKVEPKEGNTGVQVTITVLVNKKNEIRRAAVTFVLANDANTKQVMLLTQEKRPVQYIIFAPLNYTFPAAGEKKENYFTVESSAAWTVSGKPEWLKVEPKEGDAGETKVTITAESNSSKDPRTAELTFAHKDNGEIKQVVTLKQHGKTVPPAPKPNPNAVEDALFADVMVSPNPFNDQLRIANGNLEGEYILLNAQGVQVASGVLGVSETRVNTSELSAGIYLLQLNAASGATKTYPVVK